MKKVAFVALLAVCGFAVASSLNVPWFVDNQPARAGSIIAPGSGLSLGFVALHNNLSTPVECRIDYYAGDGTKLNYGSNMAGDPPYHPEWEQFGPDQDPAGAKFRRYVWSHSYNTFVIAANSTLSFRPVRYDPAANVTIPEDTPYKNTLGQESDAAVVVPNRPQYLADWTTSVQLKKENGACVITWDGDPTDIQGRYQEVGESMEGMFLLPPGA